MSLGWFLSWPRMAASQAIVIETHLGPPSRWQIVTFDCSFPAGSTSEPSVERNGRSRVGPGLSQSLSRIASVSAFQLLPG